MNRTDRRGRLRRVVAIGAVAALTFGLAGPVNSAAAHDDVDHSTEPGAAEALNWSNYEKITLTKDTGEPIDLAVLPDGRVLHTARNGAVRLTDPKTGVTKIVNTFDTYNNSEDGMQTVTLDPNFAENQWVYVYYAPRVMTAPYVETTPTGSSPNTVPAGADPATYWDQWKGYNQLSRVKWNEATDSLDLSTEQVIIKVEVQRGQCCHVAGDVDFDGAGNLYLATGDNTPASTPGANGFAPNNDAPGNNPGFDSRRGAGNSNDLRGKILRIHVEADGSYTVPAGNLFAAGTEKTRPEIFVTGVRNPFRMDVDAATNSLSWADYGPDAGAADPNRGPMGLVEWNTISLATPTNAGWPYCTGNNFNYNEWNYATATPGPFFDCAAGPINNSRWNTGINQLPAATPATLYYGDNATQQPWPELTDFDPQSGQGPMGGPVYHYDAANPSTTKFPEYWNNKAFFAEFSQDYLAAFTLDWPAGPVTHIQQFLPNSALTAAAQPITDSPIDIEFGPDGSLYVLDYGDGFFRANPDAGLYRIDYAPGNKTPQAKITATPVSSSSAPLTVQFDGSTSVDPEGKPLTFEWDFNGDGVFDATGATASYTYTALGSYPARLRVTDDGGKVGVTSKNISVGNVAPTVRIDRPGNGSFFDWGQAVPFSVSTTDPEDGNVTNCPRVAWTFGLGHDRHAHPLSQGTGCTFGIPTPADATEHGETENIFGVVVVSYTDAGANGVAPATSDTTLILNPKGQEAEWADEAQGVEIVDDATASGLRKVTSLKAGDFLKWDPINFAGIDSVVARTSGKGNIALRWNSPTAAPFATLKVDSAAWVDTTASLAGAPTGTGVLYVTGTGNFELDSLTFGGNGVADVEPPTVSATLNPAGPNGYNGWYTTNVSLTVNAVDNGTVASRQRSTDGGVTWVNANNALTISTEGTTTVLFRATDNGGNVSAVGSVTVKIDKTAPTVAVAGVADGGSIGDSNALSWTATDAVSGMGTVSATIDGKKVNATKPFELWTLGLGAHTLVVTASDAAGNQSSTTITFTTTTSLDELSRLVAKLTGLGLVTPKGEAQLAKQIAKAMTKVANGKPKQAIEDLELFIRMTKDWKLVKDADAAKALARDAKAVIAQLK